MFFLLATESSFGHWCKSFVDTFLERPIAPCRAARAAHVALSAVRGRMVAASRFLELKERVIGCLVAVGFGNAVRGAVKPPSSSRLLPMMVRP